MANQRVHPWNKDRIIGQKRPLQISHIWSIRIRLELEQKVSDWLYQVQVRINDRMLNLLCQCDRAAKTSRYSCFIRSITWLRVSLSNGNATALRVINPTKTSAVKLMALARLTWCK